MASLGTACVLLVCDAWLRVLGTLVLCVIGACVLFALCIGSLLFAYTWSLHGLQGLQGLCGLSGACAQRGTGTASVPLVCQACQVGEYGAGSRWGVQVGVQLVAGVYRVGNRNGTVGYGEPSVDARVHMMVYSMGGVPALLLWVPLAPLAPTTHHALCTGPSVGGIARGCTGMLGEGNRKDGTGTIAFICSGPCSWWNMWVQYSRPDESCSRDETVVQQCTMVDGANRVRHYCSTLHQPQQLIQHQWPPGAYTRSSRYLGPLEGMDRWWGTSWWGCAMVTRGTWGGVMGSCCRC